ncbi:uncharacterized protein LOC106766434 [Vigna radiata var. radiata]|uniref:Uncharacterized protein LOC106766434 n=1 Tax=Vigna radiata var. radiata TaxID=3916 RepID=A0A1S3UKT6_VIGRR|nr:uncharacterized protein LOC106766434 [Vigna radiata var. radiata]
MASHYELQLQLMSARGLKNVNWRHGANRPYAVVWVDPKNKCSTSVDEDGDTEATWDQTLVFPLPPEPLENLTLHVDAVHAGSEEDTEPLIGSARLKLVEVLEEVGVGVRVSPTLSLKRPSGRPQGKVDVNVVIRESGGYRTQDAYYAPHIGVRDYSPVPHGDGYPSHQDNNTYYNSAIQTTSYGQGSEYAPQEEKKSKFGGMGTGLAVGAVAGVLGGIALVEGADFLEEKIADDVADNIEDELGYDEDDI